MFWSRLEWFSKNTLLYFTLISGQQRFDFSEFSNLNKRIISPQGPPGATWSCHIWFFYSCFFPHRLNGIHQPGGCLLPELSSSLRIFSLTRSSHCCRICTASSMEQFSRRMLSMASSLSPGSRVPVLWSGIKKEKTVLWYVLRIRG